MQSILLSYQFNICVYYVNKQRQVSIVPKAIRLEEKKISILVQFLPVVNSVILSKSFKQFGSFF